MEAKLELRDLGTEVAYEAATALQEELHTARVADTRHDILLLLEHSPVYTLGRSAGTANIIYTQEERQQRGIELYQTTRGGDVTYHGPGQLVGYPIIKLSDRGIGVAEYIMELEEAIIATLADFGISGTRDDRNRGVWVGDDKVAAIGIRVSRQVTLHGFALNVNTKLDNYLGIVPCGLTTAGATSMEALLGHAVDMNKVKTSIYAHLKSVLNYT